MNSQMFLWVDEILTKSDPGFVRYIFWVNNTLLKEIKNG